MIGSNRWYTVLAVCMNMLFCTAWSGQVTIKALDIDGNEFKQAGVEQPFIVEVDIKGLGNIMQKPTIKTPSSISLNSSGYHMTSINGQVTIKHKYRAVAQTVGAYTIGPAVIEKNGIEYKSNTVSIVVGNAPVVVPRAQTTKTPEALLELTVDKNHAVVGERIECMLRFYYSDQVLQMAPVNKPTLVGFTKEAEQGPFKGTKDIKGKRYAYVEWRFAVQPTRVGNLTIGSHSADFTVQSQSDISRHFGFFVSQLGEQKRVYSNAVNITVDPLPAYAGLVHAIGSFTNMTTHMRPTEAKVGEGMVLTVAVTGNGSFDAANCAQLLHNLPSEFKHYESKQYVAEKKNGDAATKHNFEFIVQGLKPGSYQIPTLQFSFFDVATRRYKTLESAPIDVTIVQAAAHNGSINQQQGTDGGAVVSDDIRGVRPYIPSFSLFSYAIPWWIFVVLVLIPLLLFYAVAGRWVFERLKGWWPFGRTQKPLDRLRATLMHAKKTNQVSLVYMAFKDFFAQNIHCEPWQLTHEMIEQELNNKNFSASEIERWNQFFDALSEQLFFNKEKNDTKSIIQQAMTWADIFKASNKFLIVLALFSYSIGFATDPQQVCAQANALYAKKEYGRALALYSSIEDKNSTVWYNIGNCNYKLGHLMHAFIFWQRALRDTTDTQLHNDIAYNIDVVQEKIGIDAHDQESPLTNVTQDIVVLPLGLLQLLFLCIWSTLIFCFIKMNKHGKKYKLACGCLFVALSAVAGMLVHRYRNDAMRTAFIMHDNVAVFAGPHTQFHQLHVLAKTARVKVAHVRNGWAKVEHKDQVGWVVADSIAIV